MLIMHNLYIVPPPEIAQGQAPILGHGHSGNIFSNTLRNFDAELASGTLNEGQVLSHIRSVIATFMPYKQRSTSWIPFNAGFLGMANEGRFEQLAKILQKIVKISAHDRLVRDTARAIVKAYKVPSKDWLNEAAAIQHFINKYVRYTFDVQEQFEWPYRIIIDWFEGHEGVDCDCMSILFCSFMTAMGWRQVKLVLVDSKGDGVISHACAAIKTPRPTVVFGEKWINVEFTRGAGLKTTPLGWMPQPPQPMYTKYLMIDVVPQPFEDNKGNST